MVFSQGWQHFKINKAQVPHPGRPWQMRVIHSLAQLLRDPSQAGKAVPGSSPSDADEMHSRRKGRRRGGGRFLWGISNSSAGALCLASRPHLLWGRGFQSNQQAWVDSNLNLPPPYSFRIFGSWNTTMATLFRWFSCMAIQRQGRSLRMMWDGRQIPNPFPALSSPHKEESYDTEFTYTNWRTLLKWI